MKKFITLFLVLALVICSVSLFSCGETPEAGSECTHKDADDNGKCDICDADFEDGVDKVCSHRDVDDNGKCDSCGVDFEDGSEFDTPATADVTFTLQLDNGEILSGVSFVISADSKEYALSSDDNGKATASLPVGSYSFTYDYETLPSGCMPDTFSLTVTEDMTEVTLVIIDNNPNGTQAKPFFVSEDTTEISIDANAEIYFNYRGAATKYLTIANENISVTYKGTEYTAVDGVVTVIIEATIGESTVFSVKNLSGEAIDTTMSLLSPLGSMDNPIIVDENSFTASISGGAAINYLWTADKDGVLLVTSENSLNNISLTNTVTNAVSSMTAGSKGEYIAVSAGDTVRITVSCTDEDATADIDVTVNCYDASAENPIPVIKDSVDFSVLAGAALTFVAETGKTVKIEDEGVTVTVGDTVYTADDNGIITVTLAGDGESVAFTVTNTLESANGITITVE